VLVHVVCVYIAYGMYISILRNDDQLTNITYYIHIVITRSLSDVLEVNTCRAGHLSA
jgi:hypothetical protein